MEPFHSKMSKLNKKIQTLFIKTLISFEFETSMGLHVLNKEATSSSPFDDNKSVTSLSACSVKPNMYLNWRAFFMMIIKMFL